MANPNPLTDHLNPWKPGQSGNPGGKTSAHRKAEIEAAELAAKARLGLVQAFANLVDGRATDAERIALVNSDALRLLKDSEDRGFGAPKSSMDLSSEDGSMAAPTRIELIAVAPKRAQEGG
jgi:hypothetical protein